MRSSLRRCAFVARRQQTVGGEHASRSRTAGFDGVGLARRLARGSWPRLAREAGRAWPGDLAVPDQRSWPWPGHLRSRLMCPRWAGQPELILPADLEGWPRRAGTGCRGHGDLFMSAVHASSVAVLNADRGHTSRAVSDGLLPSREDGWSVLAGLSLSSPGSRPRRAPIRMCSTEHRESETSAPQRPCVVCLLCPVDHCAKVGTARPRVKSAVPACGLPRSTRSTPWDGDQLPRSGKRSR